MQGGFSKWSVFGQYWSKSLSKNRVGFWWVVEWKLNNFVMEFKNVLFVRKMRRKFIDKQIIKELKAFET